MSIAGLALGAVGLVWGVVAIVRSRSAEDPKIARGERWQGRFIISAVARYALVIAAAQSGD